MSSESRAQHGWLLSFADILTLLITFFVMMAAIIESHSNAIQEWEEAQYQGSYEFLRAMDDSKRIHISELSLGPKGLSLFLDSAMDFPAGEVKPSDILFDELVYLAHQLPKLPLLNPQKQDDWQQWQAQLDAAGLEWRSEIAVYGHTDNVPPNKNSHFKSNWQLSAMRAQQVMRILQKGSGLPPKLFMVAGFGEHQPLSDNKNREARQVNRRIEVVLRGYVTVKKGQVPKQ